MGLLPIAGVSDANVFHFAFRFAFLDGDTQIHCAVGRGDAATVAVGLFDVVVVLFDDYAATVDYLFVIAYGS